MEPSSKAKQLMENYAIEHSSDDISEFENYKHSELLSTYIAELEKIVGIGKPAGENDVCAACGYDIASKATAIGLHSAPPRLFHTLCYIQRLEEKQNDYRELLAEVDESSSDGSMCECPLRHIGGREMQYEHNAECITVRAHALLYNLTTNK